MKPGGLTGGQERGSVSCYGFYFILFSYILSFSFLPILMDKTSVLEMRKHPCERAHHRTSWDVPPLSLQPSQPPGSCSACWPTLRTAALQILPLIRGIADVLFVCFFPRFLPLEFTELFSESLLGFLFCTTLPYLKIGSVW